MQVGAIAVDVAIVGYVQTRLYGLFKSDWVAISVGGFEQFRKATHLDLMCALC